MILIQSEPFDPGAALSAFISKQKGQGAIVSFTGLVRDVSHNADVTALELEHYPGYTEAEIAKIYSSALSRWPQISAQIIHRYGKLLPADPIVFVAVSSAHRHDAFAAASFLMDYLKTDAPFWKKEYLSDESIWIEPRAEDYKARSNWSG